MPSLGFGEIIVVLIIALIVFGPKRLPEMGRTIGRSLREFRRATSDLRAEIEEDLDDEPPRVAAPGARPRPPTAGNGEEPERAAGEDADD